MSRSWTDSDLIEAAKTSSSRLEMMTKLGLTPRGKTYRILRPYLERLQIDLSHMVPKRKLTHEEIFTENSLVGAATVRKTVRKQNLIPYVCSECGNQGLHLGKPLTLQLDHKNGHRTDHRLENLRWMCPNCHSQTDTYARDLNRKRRPHSSKRMTELTCCNCMVSFSRSVRKMHLTDGYKHFCTRQCSSEYHSKNKPENEFHRLVYESYLSIGSYLGTAKKHDVSDNMVRKVVQKYRSRVFDSRPD